MKNTKTPLLTPPYRSPGLTWVSLLSSAAFLTGSYVMAHEDFEYGTEYDFSGDIEYL